jgi:hypothetical protein
MNGLFLTPVFYAAIRGWFARLRRPAAAGPARAAAGHG